MFGSSLPPVVCVMIHGLFTLFVFVCAYWCPTHMVLCCFVFVCLRLELCVPSVVSLFGLSILDCDFCVLYRLFIRSPSASPKDIHMYS